MLNKLQDVFASFQKNDVKYIIIGGIASVLYGVPRATFDLDILIEASEENVNRLLRALEGAKFGTATLITPKELLENEITVFSDRVRIDVQTEAPGLNFQDAWEKKEVMDYRGQVFYVVSRKDLIASKKAAGRDVDLEDVRILEIDKKN